MKLGIDVQTNMNFAAGGKRFGSVELILLLFGAKTVLAADWH